MTFPCIGPMKRKILLFFGFAVLFLPIVEAADWTPLGPAGGDVRSLAYDPANPSHILLGTSTGVLFASNDGGHRWRRFARLGESNDQVLDHIVFHPHNSNKIYVAAWSFTNQQSGDVFYSADGGKLWQALPAMHNKSVRALAISLSQPEVLVAGALDGVFRTDDAGKHWQQISPPNHASIKNIESIAINPTNADVIYAGTWHLAWKTTDGGAHWQPINKGMIDDSDIFSIIVDQANPSVVFASACSGIYKSDSAGDLFKKVQGIPFSARRTRVLKQDSSQENIVYAGTTEGLWKSLDLGKTWKQMTSPQVVVNDVLIDPRNSQHVLLATDRMGVLATSDGAKTFAAANEGYSHRYISAIQPDHHDPEVLYVGVVNDQDFGGVFSSHDGGSHWTQNSEGLHGYDVFSLAQASNGTLIAGTNRGLFMLEPNASQWRPANTILKETSAVKIARVKGKLRRVTTHEAIRGSLRARVNDIEIAPNRWMAATAVGLFTSSDGGRIWTGGPVLGKQEFVAVRAFHEMLAAATRSNLLISSDGGTSWKQAPLDSLVTSIFGMTITPDGNIFLATREGVFHSADRGNSWEHLGNGIPAREVGWICYDQPRKRLLATSNSSGVIFASSNNGLSWHREADSGFTIRAVSIVHGRLLAATPADGVVAEPDRQSESASSEASGGGSK